MENRGYSLWLQAILGVTGFPDISASGDLVANCFSVVDFRTAFPGSSRLADFQPGFIFVSGWFHVVLVGFVSRAKQATNGGKNGCGKRKR
jgi:hypothetical protein